MIIQPQMVGRPIGESKGNKDFSSGFGGFLFGSFLELY